MERCFSSLRQRSQNGDWLIHTSHRGSWNPEGDSKHSLGHGGKRQLYVEARSGAGLHEGDAELLQKSETDTVSSFTRSTLLTACRVSDSWEAVQTNSGPGSNVNLEARQNFLVALKDLVQK